MLFLIASGILCPFDGNIELFPPKMERFGIIILDIDTESDRLSDLYISNGIIPSKFRLDAAHIAVASIHELDCVLSFNYQHINKLKTKRMTEIINLIEGYKGVTICTPMEVFDDE